MSRLLSESPAEGGEEGAKGNPNAALSDRGRGGQVRTPSCRTGAVQELKAELFFFVVAGEEDLAVLVEAVNQTFDGVGGVPH
jgi:hypothetical protein